MGSLSWIAPCKQPLPAVFVCFGKVPEVSELSSCVLWVGFSITTRLSVGGDKSRKAWAGLRLHVPAEGFWAKRFGQNPSISAPSNMSWKWGITRRGNWPQGYNEILNWASTFMSVGQQCWEKLPGVVMDLSVWPQSLKELTPESTGAEGWYLLDCPVLLQGVWHVGKIQR